MYKKRNSTGNGMKVLLDMNLSSLLQISLADAMPVSLPPLTVHGTVLRAFR